MLMTADRLPCAGLGTRFMTGASRTLWGRDKGVDANGPFLNCADATLLKEALLLDLAMEKRLSKSADWTLRVKVGASRAIGPHLGSIRAGTNLGGVNGGGIARGGIARGGTARGGVARAL